MENFTFWLQMAVPHNFVWKLVTTSKSWSPCTLLKFFRLTRTVSWIAVITTHIVYSLEFMDRAVRLGKLLNVTILNQTGVKYYKLLIVLFGNPFVDAMESKKKKQTCFLNGISKERKMHYLLSIICHYSFIMVCRYQHWELNQVLVWFYRALPTIMILEELKVSTGHVGNAVASKVWCNRVTKPESSLTPKSCLSILQKF